MAAVPQQPAANDPDSLETQEWLDALEAVLEREGPERAHFLLERLIEKARTSGAYLPFSPYTPYVNTIPAHLEERSPGDIPLEERIRSYCRWNAMVMVARANRNDDELGGHIASFASVGTLFGIGQHHFWNAPHEGHGGDLVYFQGHSSPGIYARGLLEGRFSAEQLLNFRREVDGKGVSSYPHPWLMPDYWQFPTVSMGLGPIQAIYMARFLKYLQARGLAQTQNRKVWVFCGDGEMDEPESLGAIGLAAREKLDNLIFVVNCNLQRLDGPVRGNGRIIQELEAIFRGAGWNVIKVLWGDDWDPVFERDSEGLLVQRLEELVDGQAQKFTVESGAYMREHLFGADPRLLELVDHLSDDQLKKMRLGGHDPAKVYAAYKAAVEHKGSPTVILARTIKGYGLGEAGEGKNITHQQKKLNEQELREFRSRFGIPISDDDIAEAPFYRPADDSPEMEYLRERRQALGGFVPARKVMSKPIQSVPSDDVFKEFYEGTSGREVATTMAFVRMLAKLLRHPEVGKLIVPIIPDEARTFGMEALFRQVGIYSSVGQLYEPVDMDTLLYYKETADGQILEEGITEAGSMSSFIAAGTAYATHGLNTIPFFIYYSMFGLQRIGDLIWAAGDMRCHGFLVGGTAGRTTLAGEGLQHQDGHSHLLAYPVPNLKAYDPAFAYEIAIIIEDGIRRMYKEQEDVFYYITVMNEPYPMPAMPAGVKEGILRGLYRFKAADDKKGKLRAQLLGSGAILPEVIKAQALLAEKFGVAADVWSVTSYKELHRDAHAAERWNRLHPGEKPRVPYVSACLQDAPGVLVAASDYMKALPDSIARWCPRRLVSLGTDGFGRSEGRRALRNFFEVDARFVTVAVLAELAREGQIKPDVVQKAVAELEINPEKADPAVS